MDRMAASFGRHAAGLIVAVVGVLGGQGALAQAARDAAPGVTADSVLIGQSAKLSGSAGTVAGRQYRDGLVLAFGAANRAGGVHGRRIQLLSLDDQNDPAKALANTRTLINDKRAFALAGYTFTNNVRAALPLLQAAGVPLVGAYTGMPELYDGSQPMVFTLRASFADELAAVIRHVDTGWRWCTTAPRSAWRCTTTWPSGSSASAAAWWPTGRCR
jgi:branched-chain amino acid transport system substrate-binding protein